MRCPAVAGGAPNECRVLLPATVTPPCVTRPRVAPRGVAPRPRRLERRTQCVGATWWSSPQRKNHTASAWLWQALAGSACAARSSCRRPASTASAASGRGRPRARAHGVTYALCANTRSGRSGAITHSARSELSVLLRLHIIASEGGLARISFKMFSLFF